jgi:hypothetical protein
MKKYFLGALMLFSLYMNAQTQLNKPWTRWWWMGSAVDEAGIQKQLTQLSAAGFGGVEIVPIYGAKGFESRYIKYLSPEWMKMLDYTVAQAKALDMGVYISVGTGWPIGGSNVSMEDAATKVIMQSYDLKPNERLPYTIEVDDPKQKPNAVLSCLMAYSSNDKPVDITKHVGSDCKLTYTSTKSAKLIAVFVGKTRQAVKRAAPGGQGFTLDHFSKDATANYFKIFDTAFGNSSHGVQAFFNDSYEVYGADWTPDFFTEFQKRRGYDLRDHLQIFISPPDTDVVSQRNEIARLKSDYRETISDLMLENFSRVFTKWTNKRNTKSVNQAHGSPGNLLDLYGAFDIPECETFGSTAFGVRGLRRDSGDVRNVDPDPIMLKFASSAAHFYGKPLTSSETFTWLGEHFKTSWSQCKPELDQVFLSGVNHVFYHGTTYTPADVPFPGWLFYASVNFVPYNSMWKHLNGLNEYIARVQNVLQGIPSNNIKIYWPVYDVWHDAKGMDMPFAVHHIKEWLHPTAFYSDVQQLQNNGYEVDFLSDKMLKKKAEISLLTKKQREVIVVPASNLMPLQTLRNIIMLAQTNIDYVIIQALPKDVPGFGHLEEDRAALRKLIDSLRLTNIGDGISESRMKLAGKIVLCSDVTKALTYLKMDGNESLTKLGLKFITSRKGDSLYYFISNNTAKDIDEQISLKASANSIVFMNPLNGVAGTVAFEKINTSYESRKIRLQLKSGQSIIVRTNYHVPAKEKPWQYLNPINQTISLENNKWTLKFTEGGPYLPRERVLNKIQPWTNFREDTTIESFSGTAVYSTTFNIKGKVKDYLLQLDKLYESARVIINGKDAGIIWSLPFEMRIGQFLKEGNNTISIEVCNLMANRMRNMDINKQVWRNYHEINFVNINYKPFDASNWKVQPSGLGGKVSITALQ